MTEYEVYKLDMTLLDKYFKKVEKEMAEFDDFNIEIYKENCKLMSITVLLLVIGIFII